MKGFRKNKRKISSRILHCTKPFKNKKTFPSAFFPSVDPIQPCGSLESVERPPAASAASAGSARWQGRRSCHPGLQPNVEESRFLHTCFPSRTSKRGKKIDEVQKRNGHKPACKLMTTWHIPFTKEPKKRRVSASTPFNSLTSSGSWDDTKLTSRSVDPYSGG